MKIALFDPSGSYFSAPALRCILEEFDKYGHELDVFICSGGEHLSDICRAKACNFPVPLRIWAGDFKNTFRQLYYFLKYKAFYGHRLVSTKKYDLSIGLNPEGVIAAHRLWQKTGTPFIYLSFEMIFNDELRTGGLKQLKKEETVASRDALLVISQDPWRAQMLQDENKIPPNNFVFLPVAPRAGTEPKRTNYLKTHFKIDENKTVILHAGAFKEFTDATRLTDTLSSWPKDMILVVNTFYPPENDPYLLRLKSLNLENIRITTGALSESEYEQMLCSADIGLALYRPYFDHPLQGKNIKEMGFSSGKLSSYTRVGLPCICSGNSRIKEFMTDYNFGEYVEDLQDIPEKVKKIKQNWESYSRESRRFFLQKLDFDRFWPPIWSKIESLL
jgi:glycosyltransferase involved in cell wall biosynthesis